jgi:4-phytase/acid phosphatase
MLSDLRERHTTEVCRNRKPAWRQIAHLGRRETQSVLVRALARMERSSWSPYGARPFQRMGEYYRVWLSAEHLLNGKGCRDAARVYIYADKDQRTVETGRALAESLLPGCRLETHWQSGDMEDPLFSGTSGFDPEVALEAVRERLDPDLSLRHRNALDVLESILTDDRPARQRLIESAAGIGVSVPGKSTGGKSVESSGPFPTASTLSENLLLEYTNGMQGKDLGWGRLTKENLFQVLELHAVYADLMRRTPYLAHARGANLLGHVLRSLEQAETGAPVTGAIGHSGDALLILSGHDTNLSNLSGMLDLSWRLPGYQPDETPPGGALIFSLWLDGRGQHFVRMRYLTQTLDQMRNLDPLTLVDPPAGQDISVPGCGSVQQDGCPWKTFKLVIEKSLLPPSR